MAYEVTDKCISCGVCEAACPVDAIIAGARYHIDPEKCIVCGSCADACPVGAISFVQ